MSNPKSVRQNKSNYLFKINYNSLQTPRKLMRMKSKLKKKLKAVSNPKSSVFMSKMMMFLS